MSSETTVDKLDACCLTEYRPLPGTPQGQIIQIGGINTYHVTGKNETSKEKTIVLLTDVFGIVCFIITFSIKYLNRFNKKSTYYC